MKTQWQIEETLLKDLASKIFIQGACFVNDQYLQLRLKQGANMNNVKAILRKHFNIDYSLKYCWETMKEQRHANQEDIISLCKRFLKHHTVPLEYYNKYDPLREENTVAKRVYRYGKVRYDLLNV